MARNEDIQKTASLTAAGGHWQELCHVSGDAQEAPPEVYPVCEFRARSSHREQVQCSSLAQHFCYASIPCHHFTVTDLSSHGQKHGQTAQACINLDNTFCPNIGDQFLCFGQRIKYVSLSQDRVLLCGPGWTLTLRSSWRGLSYPGITDLRYNTQHVCISLYYSMYYESVRTNNHTNKQHISFLCNKFQMSIL